jgi:hypothetical protein
MWEVIQDVSSALILVALLAAAIAWAYKSKAEERGRLIRSAQEAQRADLVRGALEFFGVDTTGLTKEQQSEIALAKIHARSRRLGNTAFAACVVAVPLTVLLAYAISQSTLHSYFSGVSRGVFDVTPPPPVSAFVPKFEELRSAELQVAEVNDHLHIAVNGKDLPSIKLGETPGPISITRLLHRGANSLSFKVDNGESGGCGARVELWLNGRTSGDYVWHWWMDEGKAPLNANCFTFVKTLYLSLNRQPFMGNEWA